MRGFVSGAGASKWNGFNWGKTRPRDTTIPPTIHKTRTLKSDALDGFE